MKKAVFAIFLAFSMAFGVAVFDSKGSTAQAAAVKKKSSKGKSKNLRAGVRRGGKTSSQKIAAGRAAARRRAEARRRAILARARAKDNSLLRTTLDLILDDDVTGEDPEMRQIALESLAGRPGTAVIMDPNTGRVYSVVNQRWAVGKPFKPCSTIKLITSIAALNENLVDPNLTMETGGGRDINMIDALAHSDNEYFQELGEQLGFDQVISYAREWGLGEKTGINLAGESPGYLPPNKNVFAVPRMCSHGDDIGITAVQLAALTAAIANGGYLYQPQILRTDEERRVFKPILTRKVELNENARMKLIEGMMGAVNYGTAKRSAVASFQVAGKTGSCNGADSKLGLFASFSSPEHPELVVVVISTGSQQRGSLSAMVAGEIYSKLSNRLTHDSRPRRLNPLAEDFESEESEEEEK